MTDKYNCMYLKIHTIFFIFIVINNEVGGQRRYNPEQYFWRSWSKKLYKNGGMDVNAEIQDSIFTKGIFNSSREVRCRGKRYNL